MWVAASTGRFQVCLQRALVGGSVGWRGVQAMPHLRVDVGFGTHSIAAYAEAMQVPNMLPPILLDVSQGWETWGGTQPATLDLLVSINMMHIAELRCTEVSYAGPRHVPVPWSGGPRAEEGAPGGGVPHSLA